MKFSIVTVVLNDLMGLKRTHESVSTQSFRDAEWLVIDGASTDGTVEWLAKTEAPGFQWWSESDDGLYDAMNKGIERATGDYMVFLNAGDEFSGSSVLSTVASDLDRAPATDFVFGDAIDVAAEGNTYYRRARSHRSLWWTMFACHQAMFFLRERVGGQRYHLRYRNAADFAFVAEFLRKDHDKGPPEVRYVDTPLCRFWLGGNSWLNRPAAIRESYDIRARYMGISAPANAGLFLAHHAHLWLKRYTPGITRRLRYRQ